MANRSHLYTCDEIPGGEGFYARGLSEYNWTIPLVHKLMMLSSPRIVRSAIWKHDIGVIAERSGACERVLAFFEKLGAGELPNRREFDEELAGMRAFLAETPPTRYVLLEAGEIFDMAGGDLGEEVERLVGELPDLATRTDRAIAGEADDWLDELRASWEEEARPGWWSDVLYYSFDKDE